MTAPDSPLGVGQIERPFVTFALFAYNQEEYIREAVESALSQTYEPLEIILSDDCSTDNTFEIMKKVAALYYGPHTVILNRTVRNQRFGGHINEVASIARGELIVFASGDDISYPNRTTRLVEHWTTNGRPLAICSGWDYLHDGTQISGLPDSFLDDARTCLIEGHHAKICALVDQGRYCMIGCSAAYSARLFEQFEPLPAGLCIEDRVLTFRALLFNSISFLELSLVGYRIHSGNIWAKEGQEIVGAKNYLEFAQDLSRRAALSIDVNKLHLVDLLAFGDGLGISDTDKAAIRTAIEKALAACEILSQWQRVSFWRRLSSLPLIRRLSFARSLRGWRGLIFCLPSAWFAKLSYGLHRARRLGRHGSAPMEIRS